FHEECAETLSRDSSLMAWWPVAFLRALAQVERPVELDRVPRILRERFPYLSELVERSRSHHTTTLGPTCPYYKQCHFFDSARRAHNADVIIANHALVFQWPQGLPKIRNLVLDEAHHLEERITEAFTVSVSGEDISERARRLGRKKAARSATSSAGDAETIAARVETVFKGDAAALLREDAESVRAKVVQVETVLGVAFGAGGGRGGGFYRADTLSLDPPGAAIAEGVRDRVIDSLRELRAAVDGVATRMEGWLKDMGQSGDGGEDDRAVDILKGYADAFGASRGALDLFLDRGGPDYVRLLHRNARDGAWRLEVTPVDVSGLAAPLFEGKRALVLTSATMTPGQSNPFVLERVGLKDSTKMVQLPSPYQVEKQAQAYITPDAPEPGTPQHLDALVELTARVARALGGRTLLLMTSNVRLREASSRLHAMLKDDGIQVFDSATEQRAAEAFVASDRAVLLGGERYGEGLDIPGPKLTCVILEKIHEGMTRGHLAEARKARARSPIFEYDFPLRMIWLKQRVGRLIRSPSDKGAVIIFDPRVARWSHTSRKVVLNALAPMPVSLVTSGDAVAQVASRYGH
ncbi:MAG TPA: ATP-dependent DNA helicase, partial [Bdellovibrionota bacterium]|nr:ATP-dependent DNA helicase [Bdellovibrionota bacterium]